MEINASISVIVVSLTTWEAHHSPRTTMTSILVSVLIILEVSIIQFIFVASGWYKHISKKLKLHWNYYFSSFYHRHDHIGKLGLLGNTPRPDRNGRYYADSISIYNQVIQRFKGQDSAFIYSRITRHHMDKHSDTYTYYFHLVAK